ncbi:hypothetical protein Agub_g11900, partial [Astrephomene gubernaculifera]
MAAGPSITGIEGWRVALLLVGFVFVTLSFEGLIDHVEKRLKKRKGLLTAFRALKNELLYLGCLSLLLTVTQQYLAMICIPHTANSSYYKYKLTYELTDSCGEGREPLWPVSVQHETHYFIFAVAVTHILYCALTIALTLKKVGTWRQWEDAALAEARAGAGDVKVMQESVSRSLINAMCASALASVTGAAAGGDTHPHPHTHTSTNPDGAPTSSTPSSSARRRRRAQLAAADLKALAASLAAQFRVSVSQPMYHNVRLMFIEKMGLTYDFDFHSLVTNGMENQLAHAVHASWPLWLIATVFLVLPLPSFVPFWAYLLVMGLLLVVGGKLVSVTALLGLQVAIKYGDSVLFGRMDSAPVLARAGPMRRRRLSLSQLEEHIIGADGIGVGGDGVGGGADGGGGDSDGAVGAGGGEAAAAAGGGGPHVLDEALPTDAGVDVAAHVAAVTALSNRQEALNMLRTLAAAPLGEPAASPVPRDSFFASAQHPYEPGSGSTAVVQRPSGLTSSTTMRPSRLDLQASIPTKSTLDTSPS